MLPINLAAIEARQGKEEAKQILAKQVSTEDRLEEAYAQAFNPAATRREMQRRDDFRTLERRKKETEETKEAKIQEVDAKTEEDLAKNYQRRNFELSTDRLLSLKRGFSEDASPEEILEQVLEEYPDVTLADEALEYLIAASTGELQEAIRTARESLKKAKEQKIVAGRNIDPAAKGFYKQGLGKNPTELRELYRNIIATPREHNELFSELAEKYTYEKLRVVLAFLLKALGYDLKAKGPSIEPALLIRLMTDTRNLQSILWVYLFFKQRMRLIKRLYTQRNKKPGKNINFESLAKEFMRLVDERYPSVLKLLRQADTLGLEDMEKIIILSQWRDAIRQLSPRLYKSIKHRQDILLVILEALEELEEKEEEEDEE